MRGVQLNAGICVHISKAIMKRAEDVMSQQVLDADAELIQMSSPAQWLDQCNTTKAREELRSKAWVMV